MAASGAQTVAASISYTVNLKDMEQCKNMYSPWHMIEGIPWRIKVKVDIPNDSIGYYIIASLKETSKENCNACVEYRLIRHSLLCDFKRGGNQMRLFSMTSKHSNCWGWKKFIGLKELKDPENNFVQDGAVTFEARLVIDTPLTARAGDFCPIPKSGLSSLLECAVCLERYVRPKLLSCGHTFCQDCIQQISNNSTISCPLCRIHTTSFRGVDSLPSDYKVNALLEGMKQRFNNCSACNEKSTVTCLNCELSFCKTCLQKHKKIAGAELHTVVETGQTSICSRHECVATHVCADCKLYVCARCLIGPCSDHICKEVGLAMKSFIGKKSGSVQLLEDFFLKRKQDQSMIFDQAHYNIINQRDKLIELIVDRSMQLEKELTDCENQATAKIDIEEATLKSTFDLFLNASPVLQEGVPQCMLGALNTSMAGVIPESTCSRVLFTPHEGINIGEIEIMKENIKSCVIPGIESIFRDEMCRANTPSQRNVGKSGESEDVEKQTSVKPGRDAIFRDEKCRANTPSQPKVGKSGESKDVVKQTEKHRVLPFDLFDDWVIP